MTRTIACSIVLVLGLFLLVGCGGPQCTDGTSGCACDDKTPCASGLTCQGGTCTAPGSEPGAEQPAPDGTKTDGGNGSDTPAPEGSADTGPVDTTRCDAGTLGCRCTGLGGCNTGLRCESNICQKCPEGTAGCACKSGNSCNSGLKCENSVCVGCIGKAHCPCFGNNSCSDGNKCEIDSDGKSACKPCGAMGTEGCNCQKDSECAKPLVCVNKRCLDPSGMAQLPKDPKCYSPCEGNERANDGTTRQCHPTHRLAEGCQVGQTCVDGSCVDSKKAQNLSSSEYPYCMQSSDCPMWQTCIQGRCYSTCTSSSQCDDGFSCHAYVCRRKCSITKPVCGTSETCQNVGSTDDSGYCMPSVSRRFDTKKQTQVKEVFVLTARKLDLDNLETSSIFAVTNQSEFTSKLTISRQSDSTGSKTPLAWLKIDVCKTYDDAQRGGCKTFEGKPTSKEPFTIDVPGKQRVILKVLNADQGPNANTYTGVLNVQSEETKQVITVQYRRGGTGRWQGNLYSFGNFDDTNIEKFPAPTSLDIRTLKNAFLRRWLNFKRNEITFEQFQAMLLSLRTGTWQFKRVADDCRKAYSTQGSDDIVCYPYSSAKGYEILSYSQREAPPPSGVASLRFAMDVKELAGNVWQGRIVTSQTLHYPGDPQIKLAFDSKPGAGSITLLKSLEAKADLGGRYHVAQDEQCKNGSDYQKLTIPWMIPGFTLGSYPRTGSLFRDRYTCRSQIAPKSIPANATDEQKAAILAYNASLNGANPIPNGRTLRRTIELVDGLLYENRLLFAIVREKFTSPFATTSSNTALAKDWVRYGYLQLQYTDKGEITAADTQGSVVKSCTTKADCASGESCTSSVCQPPSELKQVTCDPSIVKKAMNTNITSMASLNTWSSTNLKNLVNTLMGQQSDTVTNNPALQIKGADNSGTTEYTYTRNSKKYYIHYLCADTKQFNGGPKDNPQDCPAGSQVIYFEHTTSETDMRAHSCQGSNSTSSCDQILVSLRNSQDFRENVPYRCADTNNVQCSNNRKDMREGKIFFQPTPTSSTYVSPLGPLRDALFEAFRYRIKFQSRTGKNVGFTPSLCNKALGSLIPYCYDPEVIEEIEMRVNCLEAIFTNQTISSKLDADTRATIKDFLAHAFSFSNRNINGVIFTDPGFETLNAELKVMLGDEAYTRALSSRYDLANSNLISFEGDLLEPNGIKLSGVLGYEMYNLYLSTQYYQAVLDRFYAQTDTLAISFQSNTTAFISADSITSYFQKLLLAATRKARSWGQIAKKYHQINRGDLARHVLERAYIAAYIEQLVLTQLLQNLTNVLDSKQLPQVRKNIEQIMLTYNASLLDMQETYEKVLRNLNYFGFPEGYVPFPALNRSAAAASPLNAFNTSLQTAKEKLSIAQQKEQLALQDKRSFDTSAASFQSELVKIEQNYNEQLIQICGQLKSGDQTVPAIPKYAHLHNEGATGDPCGQIPGSALYQAYTTLERLALDLPQLRQQRANIIQRIDNEEARIKKFCDDRFSLAQITWDYKDKTRDLLASKDTTDLLFQASMRWMTTAMQMKMNWKCNASYGTAIDTECARVGISNGLKIAAFLGQEAAVTTLTISLNDNKKEMLSMQRDFTKVSIQTPCNVCPEDKPNCDTQGVARIQSQNYIAQLALELKGFHIRLISAEYNTRLALSRIKSLQQRAQRLITQQEEAVQLAINVQAAQNDPNVRIYKNDAVIAAERTFEEALQEIYGLTLIYEYYTSTSYARKNDLYLARMVSSGDINLETYLSQLQQAYRDFEERYGKPALRVLVLSLRDDILRVPRADKDGNALSLQDRVKAFQAQLNDTDNFNREGYLSFSFPISVHPKTSSVSPVTYAHKVVYVEAEIKATERGDDVGRIYLRQNGTGVLREATDDFKYYTLPSRTAVINTFFNGHKTFDPSIYQNYRFQDRPLGNTQWELMFNQSTEKANQDIARGSINDIVLYVYYQDFSKQ